MRLYYILYLYTLSKVCIFYIISVWIFGPNQSPFSNISSIRSGTQNCVSIQPIYSSVITFISICIGYFPPIILRITSHVFSLLYKHLLFFIESSFDFYLYFHFDVFLYYYYYLYYTYSFTFHIISL